MTTTPLTTTATHDPRTTSLQAIVRELTAAAGARRRAAAEAKRLSRRASKDYRASRRASRALARMQVMDAEVARLAMSLRAVGGRVERGSGGNVLDVYDSRGHRRAHLALN